MEKNKMSHVLILGCGRSGTSIFGELFEHLSPYTYFSEPDFDDLSSIDFSVPVAIKVPRKSKIYPSDKGLSFSLEKLKEVIPGPLKIYWQLRHPLDTICSLKVGISNNWGHHPQPHDYENWLGEPLIKQCAYHWTYINQYGYYQVANIAQINRFEDMLADPLGFASKIAQEVGVDVEQNSSEIRAWAARVQNKNNKSFVEAKTSRAYSTQDHTVKVNRWKENLSEEDVNLIVPMIRKLADTFAYELPS